MKTPLLIGVVSILLFAACEQPKSFDNKALQKDQSFFALREEFGRGRYESTLRMLSEFKGTFETNSRKAVLEIRIACLEAVAGRLTAGLPRTNQKAYIREQTDRYGKYGVRFESPVFLTSGSEYEDLFRYEAGRGGKIPARTIFGFIGQAEKASASAEPVRRVRRVLSLLEAGQIVKEDRPAVLVRLMNSTARRTGFTSGENRQVDPSLFGLLSDLAASVRKEGKKDDVLSAAFLELAIARQRNDQRGVRAVTEDILSRGGGGDYAAFIDYWKANKAYRDREREKAVGLYQRALGRAAGLSDADLERCFIDDFSSVGHFRQDIIKRMNIIRAEKAFEKMMESHDDIAVVTGDQVRLRKTMSAEGAGNVITSLATGQKVLLLKKSEEKMTADDYTDYWYYIKVPGGHEGWVFGKYLLLY
jgi:hypothetical protein